MKGRIGRWLRMQMCQRVLADLRQRNWELAKALMVPDWEHPHGHPHTQGMRDGIQYAIDLIETEYH